MKEYYIFNIKKEFMRLYKDKPSQLFYIFNRIYYMKEIDKAYGYNLFCQISDFFDKKELNRYITNRYKDKIMYSVANSEHIINNLFLNEISILKVKSSNIKIETNVEHPAFFKVLKEYSLNLFICDFKEQNFYFLKNIKTKINT